MLWTMYDNGLEEYKTKQKEHNAGNAAILNHKKKGRNKLILLNESELGESRNYNHVPFIE